MKSNYNLIFSFSILFLTQNIQAQNIENKPNQKTLPAEENILAEEKPSDYLDKHIISKKIHPLKDEIEKNMRRLARVIRYFESEVPDSKKRYDELASDYKKALESYYGGDIIQAYSSFLSIRPRLKNLTNEYVKIYKNRTLEISSQIFNKISAMNVDSIQAPHFLIHETELRLNVLRSKIEEASDLTRFQKYFDAINLYRNAKIIGILTLYHLEEQKEKKEEVLTKYKVDLEDANYTIFKSE